MWRRPSAGTNQSFICLRTFIRGPSISVFVTGLVTAVAPLAMFGAVPVLDGLFPPAATKGTASLVAVVGKVESWPLKVWASNPGISFSAQTNKGKFEVDVDGEVRPGPCLVRLYNDEGASEPRIFIIDAGEAVAESEPNNHYRAAQVLDRLPMTINGRLDKSGDVDSFAIRLRAGDWLVATVKSHILMSKTDPVLRLVSTNGVQLAWNHDFITLDPRLAWRAVSNQTVILQVFGFAYPFASDIRLTGGEAAWYRLHVGATNEMPEVCPAGTNYGAAGVVLEPPLSLYGTLGREATEARYQLKAAKGTVLEARVEASVFGSPLDAWLKIEDATGKELARNDDFEGSTDPRLEWKAPSDGTFVVVLGSVIHRRESDSCYRLSIQPLVPDFDAALGSSSLTLSPGVTNELKFELKRLRGHTNDLVAGIQGLPPCVSVISTNVPRKDGAVTFQLTAAQEACAFSGAVRATLTDAITGQCRAVPFKLTSRNDGGYPRLAVETCEDLWLTVKKKKAEPTKKK
jgi:hypothetical protein